MKRKTFDFYKFIPIVVIICSLWSIGYNLANKYQTSFNPKDYKYDESFEDYSKTQNQTELADAETPKDGKALLDINSATEEELKTIPGIGSVLAKRIVELRKDMGGFETAKELGFVEGIGDKNLKKILPYIKAGEKKVGSF